jgi:hypothetical protein
MIRYIAKDVDNISIENTINQRISFDQSQIMVKFEIDLDNLSSVLKADLQTMADTMAISYSASETKASIIAKINEKVMTVEEARVYISENSLTWNGPDPELDP